MCKYKIVYNIGEEEEESIFFNRLTTKKIKDMENSKSYILFGKMPDFYNIYLPIDYKMTEKQKDIYYNNRNYYASEKRNICKW